MVVLVRLDDADIAGHQGLIAVVEMDDGSALHQHEYLPAGVNVARLVSVRDAPRRRETDSPA